MTKTLWLTIVAIYVLFGAGNVVGNYLSEELCFDVTDIEHVADLGKTPFALYRHKHRYLPNTDPNERGPIQKYPPWESDLSMPPKNSNFNCYIHAWSFSPISARRSKGTRCASRRRGYRDQLKGRATKRERVKIRVVKQSCEANGWCLLNSDPSPNRDDGGICEGPGDRGAPVLCGEEGRLTWLVVPDGIGCMPRRIKAFHVALLIPHIAAYDRSLVQV